MDGANGFRQGSGFHPAEAFVHVVSDFPEGFNIVDDDAVRDSVAGDGEHEFFAEAGGLDDGELVVGLVVGGLQGGGVAVVVFDCAHCL